MRRSLLSCANAAVATPRAMQPIATNLSENFMKASLDGRAGAAAARKLTPRWPALLGRQAAPVAVILSSVIGRSRMCLPVVWNTALEIAAAAPAVAYRDADPRRIDTKLVG